VSISDLTLDQNISVSGIPVQVVRKPIKNLHLSVCPPDGQVRLAVPLRMTDDNVRLAVITRLRWIKKQQASFRLNPASLSA
jgi:predicted metal-dependent hydrolase